ncbi:MAG: SpoIIE family protein phosphatase [Bacteroidales bacterium]|nr:SpoIIE family protein phosphatase [Bacteroidales bacterium]
MKRITNILILLFVATTAWGEATKEQIAYLDSLYKIAYYNYSTNEGLAYLDKLIEGSKKYGIRKYETSALQLKAGSYINLGYHNRIKELADSVSEAGMKETASKNTYYYIKFILSQSYSYQGKYKLSMNVAQELYDDSHGYETEEPDTNRNGQMRMPTKIVNRLNALSCLGTAEGYMGHYEKAIDYYNECIEITDKWPTLLAAERRDAFDGRMLASLKTRDSETKLRYAHEFEDYMQIYKKTKTDDLSADENYMMYEFYIHDAYVEIYTSTGELDKAEEHVASMRQILNVTKQAYDNLAGTFYSTMASYCMARNDYNSAFTYADSAAYYLHGYDSGAELEVLKIKLKANHMRRNYMRDYDIAQEVLTLGDSLAQETRNSSIDEISTLMGMDKLEMEAQEAEIKQNRRLAFIAIGAILLIASSIVYIQRQKRHSEKEKRKMLSEQNELLAREVEKQTRELREKNERITIQNGKLDEKNKIISESNREMTASINYAKRIQSAMLPDVEKLSEGKDLEGLFAFFSPRDIVSGDFYWAREHRDEILLACADCTGHGVPGAFMSMIGTTILNEICSHVDKIEPSEVLKVLDAQTIEFLSQKDDESVNDGMDMAFVTYNPKSMEMRYALARRPLYVVRNGEIKEIKGTKRSIGDRDDKSSKISFEGGEMKMERGDMVYMCSDGLADQFGDIDVEHPHGKRMKSAGLKQLLLRISKEPVENQKEAIGKALEEWMGECVQTDDVTLVGMRV